MRKDTAPIDPSTETVSMVILVDDEGRENEGERVQLKGGRFGWSVGAVAGF